MTCWRFWYDDDADLGIHISEVARPLHFNQRSELESNLMYQDVLDTYSQTNTDHNLFEENAWPQAPDSALQQAPFL